MMLCCSDFALISHSIWKMKTRKFVCIALCAPFCLCAQFVDGFYDCRQFWPNFYTYKSSSFSVLLQEEMRRKLDRIHYTPLVFMYEMLRALGEPKSGSSCVKCERTAAMPQNAISTYNIGKMRTEKGRASDEKSSGLQFQYRRFFFWLLLYGWV